MPRRRRINQAGDGPPSPKSIFGPDDDNAVQGEVLVALESAAAESVSASIPNLPLRGASGIMELAGSALGGLDTVLQGLDVLSVSRIHGPSPTAVENGMAMAAADLGQESALRIRYAAEESPQAVAERLAGLDEVRWAEPNRWREASVMPNDPQFGTQWGLTQIECPGAWSITTGDPSVVIAVIDTGVDLNHPELAPLLVAGQDFVDFPPGSIPRPGWIFEGDFTGVDAIPQDEVGHGTHVAGTICCLSDNAAGVAGVCWNARLMPVRVLARIRNTTTNQVTGSGSAAHIAAGIRWATDNGAQVINMSLGGYTDTIVEREAVAYAIAHDVVVVAAMGNDGVATPSYPAAYPDVIAVAATDSADHQANFSNFGPHIDISAPGVGVLSTYWDDTYATLSGTSMASPHVAGVAALVRSRNHLLSAAQVGDILRSTAKPLRKNPADAVPNDDFGYGLVQAAAAVRKAAPLIVRSRVILCRSEIISCTSQLVRCQPSVGIVCPSVQVLCQRSIQLPCVSLKVLCQPSAVVRCPSVTCPSVRCPSLACGEQPGDPSSADAAAGWENYDPYGYDPYSNPYQ
ncbi:MAG: serine protease [Pseudonocardiales bacterium]|nr:serine protease [Pseudonocardiales bacterium]